jgi:diguanylate cyclase (GGDEF)-like protein
MQALPATAAVTRRFADDQLVTLAKLVIETALQPIVEVSSGFVFGYEALLRGQQKLGFATPVELLDQASDVDLLLPMELMLLGRAVAKFSALPETQSRLLFVNFDARLMSQHEPVIDRVLQLLQRAKIAPTCVCFELSERFDNTQQSGFKDFTQRLSTHGFKLAIDDFGIGHGELRLLSELPIDFIKIDRHFIASIEKMPRKRHMVRHFVKMAHVLGMRVIAEGVETEHELNVCRDLGCDLVQGWLIERPTVHVDQLQASYAHIQTLGQEKRQTLAGDELLIRREIELLPTVCETDSTEVAFKLFRQFPLQSYFPVVDSLGMPRGIIHEQQLKFYIYQPYGRELLRNKSFQRRIGDFLTRTPFASLGSEAELLLDVFANASGSECLILTENLRYAGVLSAASLLRIINEKQLKSAQDQNPLTALPGNRSIAEYVRETIVDGDSDRALCYCDFDYFKPFNDRYGFQQGDSAIQLFATLMRRSFVGTDVFLGHVGGDDFFVGIQGRPRAAVEAIFTDMLQDFRRQVSFLYSPEDRQAGYISGADRSGVARQYPLMRCSVSVLELPHGFMATDPSLVGMAIADLKSDAKSSPCGLVFRTL